MFFVSQQAENYLGVAYLLETISVYQMLGYTWYLFYTPYITTPLCDL